MNPSLADVAAGFLMQVVEDPNADVGAISESVFDAANEVAVQAGAEDFLALARRRNVVGISAAAQISRAACDHAVAKREWDSVAPYACVHLMTLNLLDGLKDAEAAKITAEMAAHLYSQEHVLRQMRSSEEQDA